MERGRLAVSFFFFFKSWSRRSNESPPQRPSPNPTLHSSLHTHMHRYINWVQEAHPGDGSEATLLLERCARRFQDEARYRQDPRYLKVRWGLFFCCFGRCYCLAGLRVWRVCVCLCGRGGWIEVRWPSCLFWVHFQSCVRTDI